MAAVRDLSVKARRMKLQMSYRFEGFWRIREKRTEVQHEVSLERDSVKNPEETESWCTTGDKEARFEIQ